MNDEQLLLAYEDMEEFLVEYKGDIVAAIDNLGTVLSDTSLDNAQKYEQLANVFAQQANYGADLAQIYADRARDVGDLTRADALEKTAVYLQEYSDKKTTMSAEAYSKFMANQFKAHVGNVLGGFGDAFSLSEASVAINDGDWDKVKATFGGVMVGLVGANLVRSIAFYVLGPISWIPAALYFVAGAYGSAEGERIFRENISTAVLDFFESALDWEPEQRNGWDPLVLDLDNDGIETIPADGTVTFDFNGDGQATGTGWVGPDDGIVVWDRDGNGTIDNGLELLGDLFIKEDGTQAKEGFDALSDFDSNVDGVVDSSDAQFNELRVWKDLNSDGVSDAGELLTLTEAGIKSISTDSTSEIIELEDGNQSVAQGQFTRIDDTAGSSYTAESLIFDGNHFFTEYDPLTIPPELGHLPTFNGAGEVRDLLDAATLSSDLTVLLENYSQMGTKDQRATIDQLLKSWVETSDFSMIMDRMASQEIPMVFSYSDASGNKFDGDDLVVNQFTMGENLKTLAKLQVLEAFNGQRLIKFHTIAGDSRGPGTRIDIGSIQGNTIFHGVGATLPIEMTESDFNFVSDQRTFIDQAYEELRNSVYVGLALKTSLKPYVDGIKLVAIEAEDGKGELSFDFSDTSSLLHNNINVDETNTVSDFIEVTKQFLVRFWEHGWRPLEELNNAIEGRNLLPNTLDVMDELGLVKLLDGTLEYSMKQGESVVLGSANDNIVNGKSNRTVIGGETSTEGLDDTLFGFDGNDSLYGAAVDQIIHWERLTSGSDTIYGGRGDDSIYGFDGDDALYGEEGRDYIYGGDGNDKIVSGAGNDVLAGMGGDDTYYFSSGDGHDSIIRGRKTTYPFPHHGEGVDGFTNDVAFFTKDIDPLDVTFERNGTDIIARILVNGVESSVNFRDAYDSHVFANYPDQFLNLINRIEFEKDGSFYLLEDIAASFSGWNGTEDNDTIWGYEHGETFYGNQGDDVIHSYSGNDVVYGGAGEDTLFGGSGDDYLEGGTGIDFLIGDDGNDIIYGQQDSDRITGGLGNDTLIGGHGNDTLSGGDGEDTLFGGIGYDWLQGGAGSDLFLHELGDGNLSILENDYIPEETSTDTLRFGEGVDPSSVSVMRGDYHHGGDYGFEYKDNLTVIIERGAIRETVTMFGFFGSEVGRIEKIEFHDSTAWSVNEIIAKTMAGDDYDNVISGDEYGNALYALGGNDFVYGYAGDDYIEAGSGDDWVSGGDQNDTIFGGNGSDRLYGGNNEDTLHGGSGADSLYGGDGSDTLFGGDGYDLLRGDGGDDHLYSGGHGAQLEGGSGNDTYYFYQTDGNVVIRESSGEGGGILDSLKLVSGDKTDYSLGYENQDLMITHSATGSVRVENYFSDASPSIELIQLEDKTGWNADEIYQTVISTIGTDQADFVVLTGRDDTVDLKAGDDYAFGYAGRNTLYGGVGSDSLIGGDGDDFLDGGSGNDYVTAGGGNDTLFAGSGVDTLIGGAGNDILFGGSNSRLEGQLGDDEYIVAGADSGNFIYDLWGSNRLVIQGLDSSALRFWRHEHHLRVMQTDFSKGEIATIYDFFVNGSSSFSIHLDSGETFFLSDVMEQAVNATPYDDRILGGETDDTYLALGGNDQVWGDKGNDTLYGNDGDDYLYGQAGNDSLVGGDGVDHLYGDAGNDYLDGSEENDTLYGDQGNDTLIGGAGTDAMNGGEGVDTYIHRLGDGTSLINNYHDPANDPSQDVLVISGASVVDVVASRQDDDLVLTINGSTDHINVQSFFNNYSKYKLHSIQFDDAVWTEGDIFTAVLNGTDGSDTIEGFDTDDVINGFEGNDTLRGEDGNDSLYGGEGSDSLFGQVGDDFLFGGAGDDSLVGGTGSDTYYFGLGDGNDVINNSDVNTSSLDRVVFSSEVTQEEVVLSKSGNDLIFNLTQSGETLTISNYYLYDEGKVDLVEFDGGVVWDQGAIEHKILLGTLGDDVLVGTSGNDVIAGQLGADTLSGGDGNDILTGGEGDDFLVGGAGSDSYVFEAGYGNDVISMQDQSISDQDSLVLGGGFSPANTTLTKVGSDLVIGFSDQSESITVLSHFENALSEIDFINFEGGDYWDASYIDSNYTLSNEPLILLGSASNDILQGAGGDDTLEGKGGNDVLYGFIGNDSLLGGGGADYLYGGKGDDILKAGSGDDHIYAGAGNDLAINGATGNDRYYLGLGDGNNSINNNDTDAASIDRIIFLDGVLPEAIDLAKSGNHLVFHLTQSGETLTVSNYYRDDKSKIDLVEFEGGEVWDQALIEQRILLGTDADDSLIGTASADVLAGQAGNDTLDGGSGNDQLTGGVGNDLLVGGAGSDHYFYEMGHGDDVVSMQGQTAGDSDRLVFGDGLLAENATLTKVGGDLLVGFSDQTGSITLQSHFVDSQYEIDSIEFALGEAWDAAYINANVIASDAPLDLVGSGAADTLQGAGGDDSLDGKGGSDTLLGEGGNDTLIGGGGADQLYGGSGADILKGGGGHDRFYGGTGNDILTGGKGNDTYHFASGDGFDKINNGSNNFASETDVLSIDGGFSHDDLWFRKTNNHLDIYLLGSNDQVRVNNWYKANKFELDTVSAGAMEVDVAGIDALVSAMASFGAPQGGEVVLTSEEQSQVDAVIASSWQAA